MCHKVLNIGASTMKKYGRKVTIIYREEQQYLQVKTNKNPRNFDIKRFLGFFYCLQKGKLIKESRN